MQTKSLPEVLAEVFHSIPGECWTPRQNPGEGRQARFWLQHLYAAEHEIEDAESTWTESGRWPNLSERGRYFLRLRIEDVSRVLGSAEAPDVSAESTQVSEDSATARQAFTSLVATIWTRDMAQQWAEEAARFGDPRRVYMGRPKQ